MASSHRRNTTAMHEIPRCGARTRAGTPCKAPAVVGKKRCRMHGGARGSGAPIGNRLAFKHGLYTAENLEWEAAVREMLRSSRELIEKS